MWLWIFLGNIKPIFDFIEIQVNFSAYLRKYFIPKNPYANTHSQHQINIEIMVSRRLYIPVWIMVFCADVDNILAKSNWNKSLSTTCTHIYTYSDNMVTSSISVFIQFHDIVIALTKNKRNNVIYEHFPEDLYSIMWDIFTHMLEIEKRSIETRKQDKWTHIIILKA